MISLKFKSSTWIAITCFVLGLCCAFLLTGSCSGSSSRDPLFTAEKLKKQADSLQTAYQEKISTLEKTNIELHSRLSQTKAELQTLKSKNKSKAATIKKITQPPGYPARNLLFNSSTEELPSYSSSYQPTSIDTSATRCDSLTSLINEYLQEVEEKDSLYELVLSQQDSLLTIKNEQITLQSSQLKSLSGLLDDALLGQQTLARENSHLQKKIKRHRRGTRLLTLGTALISGFATHYFSR